MPPATALDGMTAIRDVLEGDPLLDACEVYTRRRPDGSPLPAIVVSGPIASPPDRRAPARSRIGQGVVPEYQLDIIQREYGDPDPTTGDQPSLEDPLLPALVTSIVIKSRPQLAADAGRVWGCHLLDGPREMPVPEEANLVHHITQVQLRQDLATRRPA